MREIRRVLKPGGRLLIVDLMSHDRIEYIVQLGHVWQGFDGDQMKEWLAEAGFTSCRYRPLPADPEAKGPTLFVATGRKQDDRSAARALQFSGSHASQVVTHSRKGFILMGVAELVEHTTPSTDRPPFKVADLSLAEFGRKEIRLAEQEMPGLMSIREEYKGKRRSRARASWARCT